jgi:hypothetical protein
MLAYIASPYSHKISGIQKLRAEVVTYITAKLLANAEGGLTVVGPIAESSRYQDYNDKLPAGFEYWRERDLRSLQGVDIMYVIMMAGWLTSKGVIAEIEYAEENGIPVIYLDPFTVAPELKDVIGVRYDD